MTLRYSFVGGTALTLFATAAGAADLQPVLKAPSAPVEQQATGYVEVYSGFANSKTNANACVEEEGCQSITSRRDGWALTGVGRGNYWITRDVSVQVDAQAEGTSYNIPGHGHISTH